MSPVNFNVRRWRNSCGLEKKERKKYPELGEEKNNIVVGNFIEFREKKSQSQYSVLTTASCTNI